MAKPREVVLPEYGNVGRVEVLNVSEDRNSRQFATVSRFLRRSYYTLARTSWARVLSIALTLSSGKLPLTLMIKKKVPFLTLSVVPLPWRHWLKWVVVVDLDPQFLLSQIARRGPWNDCANLPAVVEAATEQTRIGLVLADAEFDSERNHTYIRKQLGAQSIIPAQRGKKTWRIHGMRAETRRAFPRRLYRRRSLIESLFSSVKRKLSARAPGRSLRTQERQALLLGLSFNLYRLRHR